MTRNRSVLGPAACVICMALLSAMVGQAAASDDGWTTLGSDAVDYSPSGVPDIDQRQTGWQTDSPTSSSWTRDGPVALADALWWLDSQLEPGDAPPPTLSDGAALVQAYGEWDDHDPRNVRPLVGDIAAVVGTDGPRRMLAQGTCFDDLVSGALELADEAAGGELDQEVVDLPSLDQLGDAVGAGKATVLLLAIWQHHDAIGWRRIGGHYAALVGVNGDSGQIRISDPFRDAANPTGDVTAHNDAAEVSHDDWSVSPSLRTGPVLMLEGYLAGAAFENAFVGNHAGLNRRHCTDPDLPWLSSATLEVHIEAALLMTFEPAAVPTGSATSPVATADATQSATTSPSASVSPGATSTGTDVALTSTVSPTPSATESSTPATRPSPTVAATATPTDEPPPTGSAPPTSQASATAGSATPEATQSASASPIAASATATDASTTPTTRPSEEPTATDASEVRAVFLPLSVCSRRHR